MPYGKKAIKIHKLLKGKVCLQSKISLKTVDDLAIAYTPGVAAVSMAISRSKNRSWELTNRGNQIAIVTDGTAVLGLGDIGPEAGMPVMEGKSAIFKEFAGIDAVPLCINAKDPDEIVKFCQYIEPSFAGINLEDISAPRCFEVLEKLEKKLKIPVFHDDQDGTAIVVLAALINACRFANKVFKELRIVVNGSGAAGIAITRLLLSQGVRDIILLDSRGIIYQGRKNLNKYKREISLQINKKRLKGGLKEALAGADVFIGVSKGNLIDKEMVRLMNQDPIIFAMANPIPEIMPAEALAAGAVVVGTGRSDFPNQINNALVFPGLFKGLLEARKVKVTSKMKEAVALAIAYSIKPSKNKILPSILNKKLPKSIAAAVKRK